MSAKPGFLTFSNHILFGIVGTAPTLRGINVDVFGTAKPVHRVIHLYAFPTMIVVVFVENKIECLPTCSEERFVTLFMWHVLQFINLTPVVPLKTIVELWITFQRRILVNERL